MDTQLLLPNSKYMVSRDMPFIVVVWGKHGYPTAATEFQIHGFS